MIISRSRFLLVLFFFVLPLHADELEKTIAAYMQEHHIPGASIAVVHDGALVLARGFGTADLEFDAPATEHTVYALASLTKQFTATAIMLLAEQGKLSLDDKVTAVLEHLPSAWNGVTIRHLLSHTSGIKDYAEVPEFATMTSRQLDRSQVIDLVADVPLDFAPGERWKYSNTGYYLLGMIVERKSGRAYEDYLREYIFEPLNMSSTALNDYSKVVRHRAHGYAWNGKDLLNAERAHPTVSFSTGGLIGTVLDLAKWDAALDRQELLQVASFNEMWSPVRLNDGTTQEWGYGWRIRSARKCVTHSGHLEGFSSFMARCPQARLTVVALSNLQHADLEQLAGLVAEQYMATVHRARTVP